MPMSRTNLNDNAAQTILNILRESPGIPVEDIAEKAGKSVYWTRQVLRILGDKRLIRIELDPAPSSGPNRRLYFPNANKNRAPALQSTSGSMSISQWFKNMADRNYTPQFPGMTKAAQQFTVALTRLIRESWRLSVGEKPTAAANRAQWQADIRAAAVIFRKYAELLESVLAQPEWWNTSSLQDICSDPWIAENLPMAQCEAIIQLLTDKLKAE